MIPTDDVRYGIYFLISAAMFGYLALIAIWRMAYKPSRGRAAITAFAVSWMMLSAQNGATRLDWITKELARGWQTEVIRLACAVSLAWLVAEYGRGNLVAHHRKDDNT